MQEAIIQKEKKYIKMVKSKKRRRKNPWFGGTTTNVSDLVGATVGAAVGVQAVKILADYT